MNEKEIDYNLLEVEKGNKRYGIFLKNHIQEQHNKIERLSKENKQLKEEIENIKDFNNKLQASKDRLDKDDYNLAHILTELEEWLKEPEYFNGRKLKQDYITVMTTDVLDKIQELKEKYK